VPHPNHHLLLRVLLLLGPALLLQLAALLRSCWGHPSRLSLRVRQQRQARLTSRCCTP
jgi:hypothetical protein